MGPAAQMREVNREFVEVRQIMASIQVPEGHRRRLEQLSGDLDRAQVQVIRRRPGAISGGKRIARNIRRKLELLRLQADPTLSA